MSIRIALAGNPNCGKTTMFNELTGSSQYVGNWPGVTVEKKEGQLKWNKDVTVTDLPGVYSLSPYTLEEVVTRDYLLREKPEVIINIIDATNIERNLYLTTQLMELGIPVVVALNMADILKKSGDAVRLNDLEKLLKCTIVETSALKGTGLKEVVEKAIGIVSKKKSIQPYVEFDEKIEKAIVFIKEKLPPNIEEQQTRWFALKLLERDTNAIETLALSQSKMAKIEDIIVQLEEQLEDDSESIITNERYEAIGKMVEHAVKKAAKKMTSSDKIDQFVTNRWLALPLFAIIMAMVYYVSVTWLGTIVTDWTNDTLFGEWIQPAVGGLLSNIGTAEWVNGLVVDGIIGGVGAVLGFVPQMMILFFFLSILEDCGYMARVAFIMDRIFRKFGLSGKSFIPMLISSGCGVPGIMASKTIEGEKDRRMTIMTTTFIPCGAKLPVIALIGGAMFPAAWYLSVLIYFIGVFAVIFSGIILKKTRMFQGDLTPFVLELPQYHLPAPKGVGIHMWERGKAFIIKAGTVIFVACGVIWFLSNFGIGNNGFGLVEESESFLAAIGKVAAPVFAPLGFGNWQATVATVSGLVAKENVVGTFGVLFGLGSSVTEADSGLLQQIRTMFPYGAAAMSFLIFNMLCAPCFAAIGAIRREMGSVKWTWIALLYQTLLAYSAALIVNQLGGVISGALTFGAGTMIAIILIAVFLFLLFRPVHLQKETNAAVKAAA